MDGMAPRSRVVVLAATNRPNAIDPAVRRPGRFDREITMDVPSEGARLAMLKALAFGRGGGRGDNGADNQDDKDDSHDSGSSDQQSVLAADVDLTRVARATNGFVAADLAALWRETATAAAIDVGTTGAIEQRHFEAALARVGGPALTRGYARPLDAAGTAWNDIGGLEPVKLALRQAVEWPLVHRATFARLGLRPCRGVLLYGPPGCSKTSLVRAVAATANAAFFSISGAAVYSAYVGESERIVRSLFQRARAASPSVVFIDEIDTIVGKRALGGGGGGGGGDTVQERILSALLNEMDGIESARDVLVLAATNRPDMIDAALMRPGRFDRVIYVPPPDAAARLAILEIRTRGMPLEQGGVDLAAIAARCDMFTGADLGAVCREAATAALRAGDRAVRQAHFEAALEHIVPTLSAEMLAQYQAFAERF
nr:hypothetical protein HK105_002756 [Polyrhizophydium stewartii]